jgi:membrane protein
VATEAVATPVRAIATRLGKARTLGLAAEMSFWLFLALFPLAAVAGLIAARVLQSRQWLDFAMPAVPPPARELIQQQVDSVANWDGRAVAPLAVGTFFWLASSGVQAVFDALERQTGTSRPWWRRRLLALATCVALSIGVAAVALLGAGLDWIEAIAGRTFPEAILRAEHGPVGHVVRWALGAGIAVASVAGLYWVGVARSTGARGPVWPGAMLAVALQAVIGWGYGWYLGRKPGGASGAYGAGLAVVGATLMTIWLLSVALLIGAELNRAVAERLRRGGAWQAFAESSSQPTSRPRRTPPSTGPLSSPPRSAQPSR